MADTLAASLDIDTGFASSSVKRFEPRPSATAERVGVTSGEVISLYSHFIATLWTRRLRKSTE